MRYFNDGRQAIVKDELGKLVHCGENAALVVSVKTGEEMFRTTYADLKHG
jgi:hypothetical protein